MLAPNMGEYFTHLIERKKPFKYDYCTPTRKPFNQNVISNKYSVLIGRFWRMHMKFECFMTVGPELGEKLQNQFLTVGPELQLKQQNQFLTVERELGIKTVELVLNCGA